MESELPLVPTPPNAAAADNPARDTAAHDTAAPTDAAPGTATDSGLPGDSVPGDALPSDSPNASDASDAPSGTVTADLARLALRRVKDPELNLNIVDLGLVYDVAVDGNDVRIDMSLTSPGCPSGPEIMGEAEEQLKTIPGVGEVVVNLIWSPPWTPERIEPRVRAYMGF